MSHIRSSKIEIQNFNEGIVKLAMNSLAVELKGRTVTGIVDYYNKVMNVLTGVSGLGCLNGYGVVVKDGKLEVIGDQYSQKVSLEQFKKLFMKHYNATAVAQALSKLGYRNVVKVEDDRIMIRGMRM